MTSAVVLAAEAQADGPINEGHLRLDTLLTHWGNRLKQSLSRIDESEGTACSNARRVALNEPSTEATLACAHRPAVGGTRFSESYKEVLGAVNVPVDPMVAGLSPVRLA
jgi:hypothetical protein